MTPPAAPVTEAAEVERIKAELHIWQCRLPKLEALVDLMPPAGAGGNAVLAADLQRVRGCKARIEALMRIVRELERAEAQEETK